MYHFGVVVILFSCLALSGTAVSGASITTKFSGAVNGDVILKLTNNVLKASMNLKSSGSLAAGSYTLMVYELPIRAGVKDPCDPAKLGTKTATLGDVTKADLSSGSDVSLTSPVQISGTSSVAGKALLIQHKTTTTTRYCATIGNTRNLKTAYARFPYAVGGELVFRQDASGGDVTVYANLFDLLDKYVGTASWMTASGTIAKNLAKRCNGATNIGAKLGDVKIGTKSDTELSTVTLTSISLTGSSSIIGKLIVLKSSSNAVIACAEVRELKPKTVAADINMLGVKGKMTFDQKSIYDPTTITLYFEKVGSVSTWSVGKFPVPQKLTKDQNVCSSTFTGGTYDPFSQGSTNAIGNLGTKFGTFMSLATNGKIENKILYDNNLPLFGLNSIVGRSVIMKDGTKDICGNIIFPRDIDINVGIATFVYPVIGRIILRQMKNDPQSDTAIFIEVNYPDGTKTTKDHDWHVHDYKIAADFMASKGVCAAAGGHFNPYAANIKAAQYSKCGPDNPLQCELGDSSRKHAAINIGTGTGYSRYFFTDIDLPLSGDYSVLGRSFVIHTPNKAAPRFSCATIYQQRQFQATTGKWSNSPVTGSITFKENSAFDPVQVDVDLKDLKGDAGTYHVHLYPVPAGSSSPCSNDNVAGHFNPFVSADWPLPPGSGTYDQYEVGDLSNKYGHITGLTAKKASYYDTNLDLSGQQSIVGRSIVVHKTDKNARWVCANISYSNSDGRYFRAVAKFDSNGVVGYIRMSQMAWPDGSYTDTAIEVDLRYRSDASKVTKDHNWHVHEEPVSGDVNTLTKTCFSAKAHYNPFNIDSSSAAYATQCSFTNPLACELGDTSRKQAKINIGGGKAFYTDVFTPLVGNFSVIGRSFVVHVKNSGPPRLACADIKPETDVYSKMKFPKNSAHSKYNLQLVVAKAIGTGPWNLATEFTCHDATCQEAVVYFTGFEAKELKKKLESLLLRKSSALGLYAPTTKCYYTSAGVKLVVTPSIFLMISVVLLITK